MLFKPDNNINFINDLSDTFVDEDNSCITSFYLGEGSTIDSIAINIEKADGVYLYDISGNKYLDLFSQTWSIPLGHNHPKVIDAVRKQLKRLTHLRTAFTTNEKLELSKLIVKDAPNALSKVNFTLHGSLAVEGAMKLAINYYEDRYKILYLEDGFHGRSFATMGISWKEANSKYYNYFTHGIEVKKELVDIENKMMSEKPAAIIIELVQGNSGFKILDKKLVQGIRKLCSKHNVVMIIDEVQTAFGCVENMFLSMSYSVNPDIIVFGKAVGGGFPLAGMIYNEKFSLRTGEHSFTFGHSPVSFAAAIAFIRELKTESYKANVLGDFISKSLKKLLEKYYYLGEVRCIGTKGAIDISLGNFQKSCQIATLIVERMLENKVIISTSRYRGLGNTIMLQAPLVIKIEDLAEAFTKLDLVLEDISHEILKNFNNFFK